MKVTELGQFGMIDVVAKLIERSRDNRVESWANLVVGIGDDCAIWKGEKVFQIGKVDCQVQGVHFNLDTISWQDLGWKALAVSLSDIAATGGVPCYAMVSLGLPQDTEVENVVSFYSGMIELATLTGTAVVGGNMSGSPVIFADVSVIGKAGNFEDKYLARSAGKPGDLIAVTGYLGTSSAGLEMLTRKLQVSEPIFETLNQAFVRPQPRLPEGKVLIEKGVKSGIDISDGLLADLGHICVASGAGARIEAASLPIRQEVVSVFGEQSLELALAGGEDYELLFTAKKEIIEQVRLAVSCPVSVIGEITDEKVGQIIVVDASGKQISSERTGWDHFKPKKSSGGISN